MRRRVGVGVGRKRAVFERRFVEADTVADAIIKVTDGPARSLVHSIVASLEENLLSGQHELGYHVPVNGSQTFESEHGSGSARELIVVKHFFMQFPQ